MKAGVCDCLQYPVPNERVGVARVRHGRGTRLMIRRSAWCRVVLEVGEGEGAVYAGGG